MAEIIEDKYYNVVTLNAGKMVQRARFRRGASGEKDISHRERFTFRLLNDWSKAEIGYRVVRQKDAPVFQQIIHILEKGEHPADLDCCKAEAPASEEDILRRTILYVDFSEIFESTASSEELKSIAKEMIEQGFSLVWKKKDGSTDERTYAAFDKSGSMSRKSRMSFVDTEIYDELDRRILLDIDFGKLFPGGIILSKYYAYRGLYFSSGTRVPREDLKLGPENVLVIPDHVEPVEGKFKIVPEDQIQNNCELLFKLTWENSGSGAAPVDREEKRDITFFDGEGLISPKLSKRLNTLLGKKGKRSTAFQIRMPFTKGMVFETDFHGFIEEYLPGCDEEKLMIRDAFGILRKWKDVQLILTESMFKCFKWLEEGASPQISMWADPMIYYFEKFNEYDHALYICACNKKKSPDTFMSYQLLNTLAILPGDFKKFVDISLTTLYGKMDMVSGDGTPREEFTRLMKAEEGEEEAEEAEEEKGKSSDIQESRGSAWRLALEKNEDAINDPRIYNEMMRMQESTVLRYMTGKLCVKGCVMYLSDDLLFMMSCLIRLIVMGDRDITSLIEDAAARIEEQCMPEGSCVVPSARAFGWKAGTDCGILRNPHLSRSEQSAAVLHDIKGPYERYFGQLQSVVMVSSRSLIPLAIGGADFDGDKVRVIQEPIVVDAIRSGAYCREGGKYIRRYSIPLIPSIRATPEAVPKRNPETGYIVGLSDLVEKVFTNQIGRISNLAVSKGKILYWGKHTDLEGPEDDECAVCTIATGLEIDAAKTGIRPNLKALFSDRSADEYFLRYIRGLKNARISSRGEIFENIRAGIDEVYISKKQAERKLIYRFPDIELSGDGKSWVEAGDGPEREDSAWSNIDYLPKRLSEEIRNKYENNNGVYFSHDDPDQLAEHSLFNFPDEERWMGIFQQDGGLLPKEEIDKLDDELRELAAAYQKIKGIVRAYGLFMNDLSAMKKKQREGMNSQINRAMVILRVHEASVRAELGEKNADLEEMLSQALEELRGAVSGDSAAEKEKAVRKMLARIRRNHWELAVPEERGEKLNSILGGIELSENTEKLFCISCPDGFMILFYVLYEILGDALRNTELVRLQARTADEDYDKEMYEYLRNKQKEGALSGKYANECRRPLLNAAGRRKDVMVWCLHHLRLKEELPDNEGLFFWDVLQPSDIRDILICRNEQDTSSDGERADEADGPQEEETSTDDE